MHMDKIIIYLNYHVPLIDSVSVEMLLIQRSLKSSRGLSFTHFAEAIEFSLALLY